MLFAENNKTIDFQVIGYEFPNAKVSELNCYNHDANWLLVQIACSENGIKESYCEPCILTNELEEIIVQLTSILKGEENCYISNFTEPYLKISVEKTETIAITIDFSHITINREYLRHTICTSLSIEQAFTMLDELKQTLNKYPQR